MKNRKKRAECLRAERSRADMQALGITKADLVMLGMTEERFGAAVARLRGAGLLVRASGSGEPGPIFETLDDLARWR